MTDGDPKAILQSIIDGQSAFGEAGDIAGSVRAYALPFLHEALDTKIMLETAEDMLTHLASYYEAMRVKGVTQIIRLASHADYLSPNYIDGQFVTHLLRDSRPITPSYGNRAVLKKTGEGWKFSQMKIGFSHKTWPIRVIHVPKELPDYEAPRHDDARRDMLDPLAIYQSFINRMTEANLAGDKGAYLAMCQLPMWWHLDETDREVTTPEQVFEFCDSVSALISETRIEDFLRIADHAEFVAGNEICGYHTTHFLRGGKPLLEPVKSRLLLRRTGTDWFLHSVTNSLKYSAHPYRNPIPTKHLVTQLDIQKRTKTWPTLQ